MKKIKIGTIGNIFVGKTALCRNYLGEEFTTEQISTIGMEKFINEVELTIKENKIKTQVYFYDTSGQERYETTVFNFIEKCDGVLLVYAINFKESYNDISKWVNKIRELQSDEHFPVVLIGNKIDLDNERVINKEDGEKVAKNYKFPFYETSAKTGENVKEAFQHLIDLVIQYKEDELLNDNRIEDNATTSKCSIIKKGKKGNIKMEIYIMVIGIIIKKKIMEKWNIKIEMNIMATE